MTKRYSIFITVLFCAFVGGMLLISTLMPDREFSPLENRTLQKAPTLKASAVMDGDYMQQVEDYTADHIAFRDFWVALKAQGERFSGKQENNGVYFAADNTLIKRVDAPTSEKTVQDLAHLNALAEQSPVPVYFGLIPSAASVWQERLPGGAPTLDEESFIRQTYAGTTARTVDLMTPLFQHREEAIYYRTDHHWTSLGAYYGANALFQTLGLEQLELTNYDKTTVTEDFNGTAFSSSGVRWMEPDCIDTYVPADGVSVTAYPNGQPVEGALYHPELLDQKDKYAFFLGGNQPLCVVTGPADGPKLLVVRDSYADSLAPFLSQRCSEVHLFDLRYNLSSIQGYVQEHDIDAIAVLYSVPNFIQDQNLFLLER